MPAIERSKIAPRLRRYYLSMKREFAGREKYDRVYRKELETAAQPGGTFKNPYPNALGVLANSLKPQGIIGLLERQTAVGLALSPIE
jgi:hypothetical protein